MRVFDDIRRIFLQRFLERGTPCFSQMEKVDFSHNSMAERPYFGCVGLGSDVPRLGSSLA